MMDAFLEKKKKKSLMITLFLGVHVSEDSTGSCSGLPVHLSAHTASQHILRPASHTKKLIQKLTQLFNLLQPNSFQILEFLFTSPQTRPEKQQDARWRPRSESHPETFRHQGTGVIQSSRCVSLPLAGRLSLSRQCCTNLPMCTPILITSHQEGLQQEGCRDN